MFASMSNSAVFMPWMSDADGHSRMRDPLELPARAEIGDGRVGFAAVHIGVVEAAVLGGEELARGDEFLLRQQRGHQAGQRAAALVEFHRRRAPGGKSAGRWLPARPNARAMVSASNPSSEPTAAAAPNGPMTPGPASRGRGTPDNPADADPRRHLASGRNRDQQIAARETVALRDGQRRRHDFRRHMRHGLAMHVAHRDRGDQIAVEEAWRRQATDGSPPITLDSLACASAEARAATWPVSSPRRPATAQASASSSRFLQCSRTAAEGRHSAAWRRIPPAPASLPAAIVGLLDRSTPNRSGTARWPTTSHPEDHADSVGKRE